MKKRKVAFLVTNLDSGGIENYLLRFLQHHGNKLDAHIICKSGHTGVLADDYRSLGFNVVPMRVGYLDCRGFVYLYRYFTKHRFDSVCDFTGNFASFPLLIARFASVRIRLVFYRNTTNRFGNNILKVFIDKLLRYIVRFSATRLLSNSYTGLRYYHTGRWEDSPKFDVIYNGIDAESFLNKRINLRENLGIPKEAFVVGHIGRYNPAKNHATVLKVANVLCREYRDIYFILCGQNVAAAAEEYHSSLDPKIIFLSYRKDVNNLLFSLDAFYFPSLTEGQPNALIEAMISDVPIIASNIEPIREIIPSEFHDKILVEPMDVDAALNKLKRVYHTKEKGGLGPWASDKFNADKLFGKFFAEL